MKKIKLIINFLMTIFIIIGIIVVILYFVGVEPFVVQSGSMNPTIKTGSISFINKRVKYENIKENDIIAYNSTIGDKVTHRVISITDKGFETKGDANSDSDGVTTTKENYIGKNIFSIPKAGYVVKATQTPKGKIIVVTLIIVLFSTGILIGEKGKHKE